MFLYFVAYLSLIKSFFMIFKRTYRISSSKSVDQIRQSLVGGRIDVHHLNFEVVDKENMLKIIPHAENDEKLRILPITHLEFRNKGGGTQVKMSSKPRRIDIGGPYLLVVFCLFCIVCGLWLFFVKKESMMYASLGMAGIGFLVFIIFWIKMETGYFDYVRKLRTFVKSKL